MNEAKEQNLFQTFFRNELTWLGTIVLAIWGFIYTVVIPLNNLQIGFAQFQAQYTTQTKAYTALTNQVQTIVINQQVDEEKINQLENHIYTSK